jgi:hypothetical protein
MTTKNFLYPEKSLYGTIGVNGSINSDIKEITSSRPADIIPSAPSELLFKPTQIKP